MLLFTHIHILRSSEIIIKKLKLKPPQKVIRLWYAWPPLTVRNVTEALHSYVFIYMYLFNNVCMYLYMFVMYRQYYAMYVVYI
jgi:hypothetical protein